MQISCPQSEVFFSQKLLNISIKCHDLFLYNLISNNEKKFCLYCNIEAELSLLSNNCSKLLISYQSEVLIFSTISFKNVDPYRHTNFSFPHI